jgi:SAM-dependent methyltransferase
VTDQADRVRPNRHADTAVDRLRADYDATPYACNSFPQSAPGQLAAVAYLFGVQPAEVPTARVLEIGCAGGGNIIPFAATHPRATVVGIDLSQVQIDQGRARARALGLDNLDLIAGDIARAELTALGQFDFIIAHGVYSWVPAEVQDALLAAVRRLLAPEGVAYLSYNVYPGWKPKEILRDAMLLASGTSVTPDEKVRSARRMVDFLGDVAPADGVLARVVAESKTFADSFGDSYLLHDELETFNAPCYFYEMVERAGEHGLAYLADARPEWMIADNYGAEVAEFVREQSAGVQVLIGQYLDFVANRTFRETLLVHAARAPQIDYRPDHHRCSRMHVAACLPPIDEPTRLDYSRQEYRDPDGATLFTNDPGFKAALDELTNQWPWTMSHQQLLDAVRARLISAGLSPSSTLPDHLGNLIAALIMQGQARFRLDPVWAEPADEPLQLDESVRRMVEVSRDGDGAASTFNLWHETVVLGPLDGHLLPLLDGTRDRGALLRDLLASAYEHPVERHGTSASDENDRREVAAEHVDAAAQALAHMKLAGLPRVAGHRPL